MSVVTRKQIVVKQQDRKPVIRYGNSGVRGNSVIPGSSQSVPLEPGTDSANIHEIRYSEGDKTITVEIEGGTNEKGEIEWDVYSSTMQSWLPPHQLEPFSYEDKQRALNNISDSLTLLGMKHRIVQS